MIVANFVCRRQYKIDYPPPPFGLWRGARFCEAFGWQNRHRIRLIYTQKSALAPIFVASLDLLDGLDFFLILVYTYI